MRSLVLPTLLLSLAFLFLVWFGKDSEGTKSSQALVEELAVEMKDNPEFVSEIISGVATKKNTTEAGRLSQYSQKLAQYFGKTSEDKTVMKFLEDKQRDFNDQAGRRKLVKVLAKDPELSMGIIQSAYLKMPEKKFEFEHSDLLELTSLIIKETNSPEIALQGRDFFHQILEANHHTFVKEDPIASKNLIVLKYYLDFENDEGSRKQAVNKILSQGRSQQLKFELSRLLKSHKPTNH